MMPFFLFQKNFKSDGLLPMTNQKNEKICRYKKKSYICSRKRVFFIHLKIENYARNFE